MDFIDIEISSDIEITLYFQKVYSNELLDLLSKKSPELFYDFTIK